jgi:uncharacterized protein
MQPTTAAMFPLGTVLFPYAVIPLHVFEPRYRTMMRAVLDGDQEFGVVLIERGSEVGTIAHVVSASELPDVRFALAAVGVHRFRVDRWLPEEPYPRAEISEIEEPPVTAEAAALVAPVVARLQDLYELSSRAQGLADAPPISVSPDAEQAAFELAALASLGPLDAQRVLELPDAGARLAALDELLSDALAMLRARLDEGG